MKLVFQKTIQENPATIADNVGDNVGDTAGMGADIFESYCGSVIATMFIGSTYAAANSSGATGAVILPIVIITIGLLASVLGILAMNTLKGSNPAMALRVTPIISLGALFIGAYYAVSAMNFTIFPYAMGHFTP